MGLDMYLERKTYVKNWNQDKKERFDISVKRGGKKYNNIDASRVKMIVEEVGYWRKANAIHRWFVSNVQDGEDDCKEYEVSEKQLEELLSLCKQVKSDPKEAPSLLPTQSGFFFGSTEYGEYYMEDIDNTINIVESCLGMNNADSWFVYSSSW